MLDSPMLRVFQQENAGLYDDYRADRRYVAVDLLTFNDIPRLRL